MFVNDITGGDGKNHRVWRFCQRWIKCVFEEGIGCFWALQRDKIGAQVDACLAEDGDDHGGVFHPHIVFVIAFQTGWFFCHRNASVPGKKIFVAVRVEVGNKTGYGLIIEGLAHQFKGVLTMIGIGRFLHKGI